MNWWRLPAARAMRRLGSDLAHRSEPAVPKVGLVVPTAEMFSEDSGQSFTIQIDPAVTRALGSDRQIFKLGAVDGADGRVDNRPTVGELNRRQLA